MYRNFLGIQSEYAFRLLHRWCEESFIFLQTVTCFSNLRGNSVGLNKYLLMRKKLLHRFQKKYYWLWFFQCEKNDSDCWVSPDTKKRNLIASLYLGGIVWCNLVFLFSILGPTNSSKCSNWSGEIRKYWKNILGLPLNQGRVSKMVTSYSRFS